MRLQAKFLRVLQEREVRRIGETIERKIDIQVIAASNKDLQEEIRHGGFREDLYYRLKVMNINVPPLRERSEDIPNLVEWFLIRAANAVGGRAKEFTREAMQFLSKYQYPGNVRELMHIVESCYYAAQGRLIEVDDLPIEVRDYGGSNFSLPTTDSSLDLILEHIWQGDATFQDAVKVPFLQHKLDRRALRVIVHTALTKAGGYYRDALRMLRVPSSQYSSTIQFLKRNGCYLDYGPYRRRSDHESGE